MAQNKGDTQHPLGETEHKDTEEQETSYFLSQQRKTNIIVQNMQEAQNEHAIK